MRKTVREILAMGKEGFVAAMLAEWDAKLRRPDLSLAEREPIQGFLDRVEAERAETRPVEVVTRRAA